MTKNTEIAFSRAQTRVQANHPKISRKIGIEKPDFSDAVTGNRKPETGDKINEIGPTRIRTGDPYRVRVVS